MGLAPPSPSTVPPERRIGSSNTITARIGARMHARCLFASWESRASASVLSWNLRSVQVTKSATARLQCSARQLHTVA